MTATGLTQRATYWQLRTRRLQFGKTPALMGILNVTPDSFSDGGKYYSPSQAVEQALRLEDAGADILDIGGESTRPYSQPVAAEDELRRVLPVIESIAKRVGVPISIDTSKASVAAAAIELGAEIINDVTGLEGDTEMIALAARTQVGVCAMHMRGTPQTMQDSPEYDDIIQEIGDYLRARDIALQANGISADRICLDPGIGFGKTHEHNIQLASSCTTFVESGRPILVGHSRKGFIGKILDDNATSRVIGSVGISLALARQGVQVLRIHDVEATRQGLTCFVACGGLD